MSTLGLEDIKICRKNANCGWEETACLIPESYCYVRHGLIRKVEYLKK